MRIFAFFFISAVMMVGLSTVSRAYEGEWHDPDRHEDQVWHGDQDRHEDQDWHGNIRQRIREDHRRIEQGVEHGSLTKHEAMRLGEELNGILDKIDRMKRDGRLDEREREAINRDLDRLDNDITREKRDDDRREGRDKDDNTIHFDLKL